MRDVDITLRSAKLNNSKTHFVLRGRLRADGGFVVGTIDTSFDIQVPREVFDDITRAVGESQ